MRWNVLSSPLALGAMFTLCACNHSGAASTTATAQLTMPSPAATIRVPAANQCDLQAVQHLVGQPYSPELLEQARTLAGAGEARMLWPDSTITKEYQMGRLNVIVDRQTNRVLHLRCG